MKRERKIDDPAFKTKAVELVLIADLKHKQKFYSSII